MRHSLQGFCFVLALDFYMPFVWAALHYQRPSLPGSVSSVVLPMRMHDCKHTGYCFQV